MSPLTPAARASATLVSRPMWRGPLQPPQMGHARAKRGKTPARNQSSAELEVGAASDVGDAVADCGLFFLENHILDYSIRQRMLCFGRASQPSPAIVQARLAASRP